MAWLHFGSRGGVSQWPFLPSHLFQNGEQGAWFDPSDLSTLYQESTGLTPVTEPGQPVGLMLDKSGNGNRASQAVSAARPIYGRTVPGGRTNWVSRSTPLADGGDWSSQNISHSFDGDETLVETTDTGAGFWHSAMRDSSLDYVAGAVFKMGNHRYLQVGGGTTSTGSDANSATVTTSVVFDLLSGDWVSTPLSSRVAIPMGDGYYFIGVRLDPAVSSSQYNNGLSFVFRNESGGLAVGDGHTVFVKKAQANIGTLVPRPYQRVGSAFDVTEEGQREVRYLQGDGVDDALVATLPDLGTDAVIAYASDQGVTVLTGQTVSGAFNVLRDSQLFGMIVHDAQLAVVETYLERKAP